jgi:hypothetical protein
MAHNRRTNIPKELMSQGENTAWLLNERPEVRDLAPLVDDLQAYGRVFVEWSKKSRRDFRGLVSLIDALQVHHGLYDQMWKKSRKWMSGELAAIDDRLSERLKRYDSRPFPFPSRRGTMGISIGRELLNKKVRLIEARVFNTITRLIEHDEFDRLRRCARKECRRWLFAGRRRDKRYCSTLCRQTDFENTPERKKQKLARARGRYPLELLGRRPHRRKHAAKTR